MSGFSTGMFESLSLLYKSHGGYRALFRSSYFYAALLLTVFAWPAIPSYTWTSFAIGSLPTLAGFSIAAFAILFAVLDTKARAALSVQDERLGNRSPMLILASSICHAVVVQLFALIYAYIFQGKPIPVFVPGVSADEVNLLFSLLGLILTLYAVVLVLAAVLSIFRLLEIQSRITKPAGSTGQDSATGNEQQGSVDAAPAKASNADRGALN